MQVAQLLGVKYREGFVKNRYIGRTFIMPGQEQRAKSVRRSSTPSTSSSAARTCCWSTTPSCAARPRRRSSISRARPAHEGLLRLRRAAGALPERLRHRHAGDDRAGGRRPHRGRSREADRRRLADLPGSRRPGARLPARRFAASRSSTLRASPATTSPATSRRAISRACRKSAPTRRKHAASSCIAAR